MREKIERIMNYYKFVNNIKRIDLKNQVNEILLQCK